MEAYFLPIMKATASKRFISGQFAFTLEKNVQIVGQQLPLVDLCKTQNGNLLCKITTTASTTLTVDRFLDDGTGLFAWI